MGFKLNHSDGIVDFTRELIMAIPFKKIFKRIAISMLAIVVLVLIVFTGWREFSQYRVAREREIQTENGNQHVPARFEPCVQAS